MKSGRPSDVSCMVRMTPALLRHAHIASDAAIVAVAWLIAWGTRSLIQPIMPAPINPLAPYFVALPFVVVAWISSCWAFGIYDSSRMESVTHQVHRFIRGTLLGFAVVSAIAFFGKELDIGRTVVVLTAFYCFPLQGISRLGFHRFEQRCRREGIFDVPVLILGAGITGVRLLQKLQDHPEIGFRVVGFLDNDANLHGTTIGSHKVLGGLDQVTEIARVHDVAEVFLASPGMSHAEMLSRVLDCEDLEVGLWVVTNFFEVLTADTHVELVDDVPVVRLGSQRPGALYGPTKRLFDFLIAAVGLLLLAPFFAWWAWRIRRDSSGPAFFVQERVGLNAKPFRMWKFRTMICDTDAYEMAPRERDDPRATPYGAWLRRTSIDELPQLWNVLKGEMSLVGPRPEMPFIVDHYEDWQRRRLTAKPGIAGLWQILGRKDLPMQENLQYDFYYIRNRSLGRDLSLLLRTLGAVLTRRGAY
jgi:exopolysaccharide biosynthesis polyprenyl glycosylphosphotransferase